MDVGVRVAKGVAWLRSALIGLATASLLVATVKWRVTTPVLWLIRLSFALLSLAGNLFPALAHLVDRNWIGAVPAAVLVGAAFAALAHWLSAALLRQRSSPLRPSGWILPSAAMVVLGVLAFVWPTPRTFVQPKQMLYQACLAGNVPEARRLLDGGADVNARSYFGGSWAHDSTPLMAATLSGNLDLVRLLLERGADVRLRDSEGRSAVDYAVTSQSARLGRPQGDGAILELLLSRGGETTGKASGPNGADFGPGSGREAEAVPETGRWSPLHDAVMFGNPQTALTLIKAGADVNAIEWDGSTALGEAVRGDKLDVVGVLLRTAPILMERDAEGSRPFSAPGA